MHIPGAHHGLRSIICHNAQVRLGQSEFRAPWRTQKWFNLLIGVTRVSTVRGVSQKSRGKRSFVESRPPRRGEPLFASSPAVARPKPTIPVEDASSSYRILGSAIVAGGTQLPRRRLVSTCSFSFVPKVAAFSVQRCRSPSKSSMRAPAKQSFRSERFFMMATPRESLELLRARPLGSTCATPTPSLSLASALV